MLLFKAINLVQMQIQ